MIMKTKLILLLTLVAVFSGCDKIKDATTVPIQTNLKADIPVVVTASGKKSAEQAGSVNAVTFTKTQDLSLSGNTDIEPYISKIKSIDVNSLVVTVTGLSAGQTINSVALDVTGVGNIFTQTNISMSNNSFTPVIASGTLDNVATKLTSDKKLTLTVSGNASGPMTFTVSLNFDVTVIAGVL
jgi:hypothetical protein